MLALILMSLLTPAITTSTTLAAPEAATMSSLTFRDNMRKLWEDHITWTRLYHRQRRQPVCPTPTPPPSACSHNQTDIGNAIKPYYGDAAGDQLTALLKRSHPRRRRPDRPPPKQATPPVSQPASDKWYANADDIADLPATAPTRTPGPWTRCKMDMKMHLDQTLTEAVDHLKGNYAADVADYDKVHDAYPRHGRHPQHRHHQPSSPTSFTAPPVRCHGVPPSRHAQAVGGPHHLDAPLHRQRRSRLARHRRHHPAPARKTRPTSATPSKLTTVMPAATQLTSLLRDHILGAATS